ncbi:MAG: flagellar basal-body rod protein FlgF [Alphaproteobacteria bacterium]|nr:flagellar basal-body rod protein FlgF [Alphaproteobacteria bacterium]
MQAAGLILTSYQDSLTRALDVVSNNVANSNTTGFKREDLLFDTLIVRPTPGEKFEFALDHGTYRNAAAGPMQTTGGPLDIAIQGQGYFMVRTDGGIRYTRAGAFMLNGQGEIVTPSGEKVLGDGDQPIALPDDASDILVASDGVISVKSGTGTSATQVGKLKLVKFANEQDLQSVGNSQYSTTQTPQPDTDSQMVQGMVEQSNVQSVKEITNMIEILRTYQQTVHLLDLENQRQANAISRLAKVTA